MPSPVRGTRLHSVADVYVEVFFVLPLSQQNGTLSHHIAFCLKTWGGIPRGIYHRNGPNLEQFRCVALVVYLPLVHNQSAVQCTTLAEEAPWIPARVRRTLDVGFLQLPSPSSDCVAQPHSGRQDLQIGRFLFAYRANVRLDISDRKCMQLRRTLGISGNEECLLRSALRCPQLL